MSKLKTANEILTEKRSTLVNGAPRGMTGDLSGSPLTEADTVYWKSVSKKFPVTKEGETFYATMPDGKQKVEWKPDEEEEARKHLDGLVGKKESVGMRKIIERLKDVEHKSRNTQVKPLVEMVNPIEAMESRRKMREQDEDDPKWFPKLETAIKRVHRRAEVSLDGPPDDGGVVIWVTIPKGASEYPDEASTDKLVDDLEKVIRTAIGDRRAGLAGVEEEGDDMILTFHSTLTEKVVRKKNEQDEEEMDDEEDLPEKKSKKESTDLDEEMSREAGILNAKDPKVEFNGVEQLPGGKLGLKVTINGVEYIYAPQGEQKQATVAHEAFKLGTHFKSLLDESPGKALAWLRRNAVVEGKIR